MALNKYNIDLQNGVFPMLSEQKPRTLIGSTVGEAPAKEKKPGIVYCHNVMPSIQGTDSVGYLSVIEPSAGVVFSDVRVIYGDDKSRLYLAWDTTGNIYALLEGATSWLELPATDPVTVDADFSIDSVTIGTVNGISYIFYAGIACFIYSEGTNSLDVAVLEGLTIEDTLGIVASSGYQIAYTVSAVAWSSTILPTDFEPSQVTGAGGGNVAGIAGDILFCTPNSLGILIYTTSNIVACTYTGNALYPFKFREVENSKGGINLDRIAYEANSGEQYVYSKAGLQAVNSRAAETILPEVTDFLAGKRFEDFNETTGLYELTDLTSEETMLKKIKFIASRYLVISYGLPDVGFTHSLVYDTTLKKIGKLKIAHVDVFEYIGSQEEISKESLAYLAEDGEVQVVDFSATNAGVGVLVLGKVQHVVTRLLTLLEVAVENIPEEADFVLKNQVALDGKNFVTEEAALVDSEGELREYHFRSVGINHSLVLLGSFSLASVLITYTDAGRR